MKIPTPPWIRRAFVRAVTVTVTLSLLIPQASIHSEQTDPADFYLSSEVFRENLSIGTTVSTAIAVGDGPFSFSLVPGEGDDSNDFFRIEGNEIRTAALMDHEERDQYTIRIRATDAMGSWVDRVFSLAVVATTDPRPVPGELDLSFDPGPWPNGSVEAIAIQDDGRLVIGGSHFSEIHGEVRNRIARLNPDGTLDHTFGDSLSGVTGAVYDIAVQPDGKALIGGSFHWVNGIARNGLARLNPDGSTDQTFDVGVFGYQAVHGLALQEDGKVVIGGSFYTGIARLHPDGTLDTSFAAGLAGTEWGRVHAVAIQNDGKILIAGSFDKVHGVNCNNLARLRPDGTLDTSFLDGRAGQVGTLNRIVIQDDGKILVAGNINGGVARLHSNGLPDHTFGNSGASQVYALALQDDGKILIGGWFSSLAWGLPNRIARLHADGTLDRTFGSGLTGASSIIEAIAVQPDGQIVIGGGFSSVNGVTRGRLARLHGGYLPPSDLKLSNALIRDYYPVGTTIGTLSATDLNAPAGLTFSFSSGEGSEGNSFFIIDGNQLKTAAEFDAATQQAHTIRVRAANSQGLFVKHVFTLTVEPNFPPEAILLSNSTILENQPAGSVVGTLKAADPNEGDTHTFTLVSGSGDADNPSFTIEGAVLKTAAVFSYAEQDSFSIRARATDDQGAYLEKVFTILVIGSPPGGQLHLHPSFDTVPALNGPVTGAVEQIDGGIVVVGSFTEVYGTARGRIARFHADGSLDSSFMDNLAGANGHVRAVALQGDGKIVIGGNFTEVNGTPRQRIARLNADGSLDATFGGEETGIPGGFVLALALQPDGRILLGGDFDTVAGQPRRGIARLNTDGTLDAAFGQGLTGTDGSVLTIALESGGQILIGGTFTTVHGSPRNRIARLWSWGGLAGTFSVSGSTGGANRTVRAITVQPDGKILIGGSFTTFEGHPRNGIIRLNPSHTIDLSFQASIPTVDQFSGGPHAIALQADGRILVGGLFTGVNGQERNRIARLHTDGSLDHSVGGTDQIIFSVVVQRDGNILIAGGFTVVNGVPRDKVARLFGGAPPWNEPPGSIELSSNWSIEGRPTGTVVGILSVTDPNEDDVHVLAFATGEGDEGNGYFRLHGDALQTAGEFPPGSAGIYTVRLRATDAGGLFVEKILEIVVEPNFPPTDILLSNHRASEDLPAGASIGILSAVDANLGDKHTFTLVGGEGDEGNNSFIIQGNILKTARVFSYHEGKIVRIRVQTNDVGGLSTQKILEIEILPGFYHQWAESLPKGERGMQDDPGGHGIPNLLRYAFAMGPLNPEREKLPRVDAVMSVRGGTSTHLQITYTRRKDDGRLRFTIESSENLGTWSALLRPVTQITDNGDGLTETVTVTDTQPIDNLTTRFLRVRVER
jgi:uncharacterized delta-60 repeat protein